MKSLISGVEDQSSLEVYHKDTSLYFNQNAFGPGNYDHLKNRVARANLEHPTLDKLVYFIHNKLIQRGESDIYQYLDNKWLLAFNSLLYVPGKGVYVEDEHVINDVSFFGLEETKQRDFLIQNEKSLAERLKSSDPRVRFVSFGDFKTGMQTPLDLASNKLIIALAGLDGAEKLAQISSLYPQKPYLWAFENLEEEKNKPKKQKPDKDFDHIPFKISDFVKYLKNKSGSKSKIVGADIISGSVALGSQGSSFAGKRLEIDCDFLDYVRPAHTFAYAKRTNS